MRFAVTGANGFFGKHLVRALLAAGHEVTAVARDLATLQPLDGSAARLVATDYSTESIRSWLPGHDGIVHLGARRAARTDGPRDLEPYVEPNLLLTGRLADAAVAAGVGRFVFASTIAVYSGPDPLPYLESGTTHPVNAYGLSKLIGEQLVELKCRGTATSGIRLRFAALFGAGERTTGVLMRFLSEAEAGNDLVIKGNPGYGVDQLYIDDAVAAVLLALTAPGAHGPYNIGAGRTWAVAEMAETVASHRSVPIRYQDRVDDPLPQPFMRIDRATRKLGWSPRFDLASGIARMLATP